MEQTNRTTLDPWTYGDADTIGVDVTQGLDLTGYSVEATDGGIGHVQGMLVDEDSWAIRYLVVDTSNWWFGHQVLIAPRWIQSVSWSEGTVSVNLTRQTVKDSPPYDSESDSDPPGPRCRCPGERS